ncbi:MAG: hypothetical protein HY553_22760 [Elusimicrobia bacterium]|nr:hypothetical protein [Elusimicrobiota bacterium]
MDLLIGCCLILITIALWGGMVALILAAVQVRRTAQAVEVKVYEVGDHVDRLRDVAAAAGNFAGILRSPWMKGLGLALGAATTYYTVRTRSKTAVNGDSHHG